MFGPELTWSRKYLVPNSPLGPEFTWSRIHLIPSLSSLRWVVFLLLCILFFPISHSLVSIFGLLYITTSLLLALKMTLSNLALLSTACSITWVSTGVDGSIEISSATVGAPTFVVPMVVPRLFSSICLRRGCYSVCIVSSKALPLSYSL